MSDKPGVLYALENLAWPGWIKIGRAEGSKKDTKSTIRRRLYQYNTGDPQRGYTVLEADYASCCHAAESYAHTLLELHYKRGGGEWFRCSEEQAREIVNKACHIARLVPTSRPERFKRILEEARAAVAVSKAAIQEIACVKDRLDIAVVAREASDVIRGLLECMAMPCDYTEAAAATVLRKLDFLGDE